MEVATSLSPLNLLGGEGASWALASDEVSTGLAPAWALEGLAARSNLTFFVAERVNLDLLVA
jgi:hypothetical protein